MNNKVVAFLSAIGGVGAALVTTQAFGANQWVTYVALGGLAITSLLTHNSAEQVNRDLHNGTFEELLKNALIKLAKENGVPLEIKQDAENPPDRKGDTR